jgi:hypothetical protein
MGRSLRAIGIGRQDPDLGSGQDIRAEHETLFLVLGEQRRSHLRSSPSTARA